MQTPHTISKLPFGESTNKASDPLKSAKKSIETEKIQQAVGSCSHLKEDFDWIDCDNWAFPEDRNCFCCGDDRKSKSKYSCHINSCY